MLIKYTELKTRDLELGMVLNTYNPSWPTIPVILKAVKNKIKPKELGAELRW
jgi:hypothetical protein